MRSTSDPAPLEGPPPVVASDARPASDPDRPAALDLASLLATSLRDPRCGELPDAWLTPELTDRLCAILGALGGPAAPGAASTLAPPGSDRAAVQRLLGHLEPLFIRAGPSVPATRVLAHLVRAGHVPPPDRARFLAGWEDTEPLPWPSPRTRPSQRVIQWQAHSARRAARQWALYSVFVEDPTLDPEILLQFVGLLSTRPSAAASLGRVIHHPMASDRVWAAALDAAQDWSVWDLGRVYEAIATAPALASRPAWRTRLQLQGFGASPVVAYQPVLRALLARPDLDWAPETARHAIQTLLDGPWSSADVDAALRAASAPLLAVVPADVWAGALATRPRDLRVVVLRTLARLAAPTPAAASVAARAG